MYNLGPKSIILDVIRCLSRSLDIFIDLLEGQSLEDCSTEVNKFPRGKYTVCHLINVVKSLSLIVAVVEIMLCPYTGRIIRNKQF